MGIREILGCFACRVAGGTTEPHRDMPLKPFGIGYVHERCRVPGDELLDQYPLCTLPDDDHYPYPAAGKFYEWPHPAAHADPPPAHQHHRRKT